MLIRLEFYYENQRQGATWGQMLIEKGHTVAHQNEKKCISVGADNPSEAQRIITMVATCKER